MLLSGISTWVRQDFSPHPPILGLQLQQGLVEVPGTRVHAETGPLNRPLEERLTHFEIQMSPDPLQPAPAPGWVVIVLLKGGPALEHLLFLSVPKPGGKGSW